MRMVKVFATWHLVLLLCLGAISQVYAQNLVPNPSFEIYTDCPPGFGSGGPLQCTPWQSGSLGTTDYFHVCSPSADVGIPDNFFGSQNAHTGSAYAGGFYRYNIFEYREYLQVQLLEPLEAGFTYDVSYYVSLADVYCGVATLGLYVSENPPPGGTIEALNVVPQVESSLGYVWDKTNWVLISGCYAAQGGEQWITIGNFYDDGDTPVDPDCSPFIQASYYYIDDVVVIKSGITGNLDLELGDPVVACISYEIDSGVDGVEYLWSDGSTDPTLVVTESGTYALTISLDCEIGIDSVEVFFDGVPDPVDLGPPEVTICNGDSYDISLDPSLGEYEWQDGSSDADYSITTSGVYTVSFDDGCDVSTDAVTVFVLDVPAPFSLGGDAYLCPGDELSISFDPGLGDFSWQDGSTTSFYTIDIGGIYQLTISNMCGQYTDDMEVIEIPFPQVDLGPDQVLCEGDFIDIDLNPNLGEYVWQDGSTSESYTISTPGSYAVTMTNQCGTVSDQLEVSLTGQPVFNLGQDIIVCPAQLPITLDASEATNATSFIWQDGSTSAQFLVSTAGTYSVTVSSSCFSISDTIVVIEMDASPVVVLPPDQNLCPGQTFILDGSGTPGNYLWQDGSTNSTFSVSQEGTYFLSVTNQCGIGVDSVQIAYTDSLSPPDLGPDVSLCPGEQYIFYANVTGVNYSWQDLSTADSLLVSGAGTYALSIGDMCTIASDTVEVTISDNPPQVNLPSSLNLCASDTIMIDAGISGVGFLWSDGSTAASLSVFSPGTYSLTVSNACGTDSDTIHIIDGGPAPMISLGQDISFCSGDVNLITPVSSNVNSLLWQDGSTASTYMVASPGVISVQATNNCGVSYDTLIAVLLPDIPVIQLGADTSLCPGESFTLNINTTDVDILWSDGSTGSDFIVTDAGLVYATITNECGSASDSVDIAILPSAPTLDLGMDQSLCPGEIITLSPDINGVSYLWQDGSTASTYNATQAEQIILTVSNSCGVATDTLDILIDTNGPQLNLGPDITMCEGEVATLKAGIAGVNYLWQDGSTSPDFTTSIAGVFILQVSNSCGVDVDTVEVIISGVLPFTDLGNDTLLCSGESLVLSTNPVPGTNVVWQDGSSSPNFTVTSSGSYHVSASNQCGDDADTIIVSFISPPVNFSLGPDTILCPGESILLKAPQTNLIITWQDGSHEISIMADQPQLYSLQLTNECGTAEDDILVGIDYRTPSILIDPTIPWCEGDVITLDATQTFSADYLWNNGSLSSTIEAVTPGVYSVSVITECQSVKQDIEVIPGADCKDDIYIPSVFSPNDDQTNDVFLVSTGIDVQTISIRGSVFDRWGNMVFHSDDVNFSWDGRFNGSDLMPGVYVYYLELTYLKFGQPLTQILYGDVTLLR